MPEYREYAPSPELAAAVECFWSMRQTGPGVLHRVVPDGCADILFTRNRAGVSVEAIGPMTTWRDHLLPDGQLLVGVRFRPGMWSLPFPGESGRLTDRHVPLDALWGARACNLLDRLGQTSSAAGAITAIEKSLPPARDADPLQRALSWMENCHGVVSLDFLASQAGLSARQFRRVFLQRTGLSPKFLARVLRFRRSLARVGECAMPFAQVALECGYYDQAHFINEFREFSGRTPGMADFSNPLAARQP